MDIDMERLINAIKAFFAVLGGASPSPAPQPAPKPEAPAKEPVKTAPDAEALRKEFEAGAVYALSLLQREGRLVDFLQEDISPYSDAQVGMAVRQIHSSCAKLLKEKFQVEPVLDAQERQEYEVKEGFDPCELKLTGEVPEGKAPGKGVLQHKGWKAAKVSLPARTGQFKAEIVCQAEISF